MDTQANNSLIKVEEFNQIMQSAPAPCNATKLPYRHVTKPDKHFWTPLKRKEVLARMNWMRRSQSIWQRRK